MGELLRLSLLGSVRKGPFPERKELKLGLIYFCTHCNADRFILARDGGVYCGPCGSLMGNIRVTQLADASAGKR